MTVGNGRVDVGPSRVTDRTPEPDDPDRVYEQRIEQEYEEVMSEE